MPSAGCREAREIQEKGRLSACQCYFGLSSRKIEASSGRWRENFCVLARDTVAFPMWAKVTASFRIYDQYSRFTISKFSGQSHLEMSFPRIRAAAIDGRLTNVFARREQLTRLHSALAKTVDTIQKAIVKDSGNTLAEAAVEYSLALATLKKQVESLNPEKELEDEYRTANGKDAADRREAVGVVYIEPTSHTFFFSVIAPLSISIAAGNCVVVQVCLDARSIMKKYSNVI
jgi:acyl-CoA reductase-like NAD-dependent aldehyde dehydrogenase